MAWLQLILESDSTGARQASELLEQFGAIAVSLSALDQQLIVEQHPDQQEELWEHTQVTALLHEDIDLDVLLASLRKRLGPAPLSRQKINLLPDKDWVMAYQQSNGPRIFGNTLCICPGWHTPPAHVDHILNLDPGLAFGTGSHETTGLCLDWLVKNDIKGKRVIDYGCGSGILALAAVLLGASHAWAIDNDPQALQSATANAARNHVSDKLTIAPPDEFLLPAVDVLLANILLNPLQELAARIAELVLPGGSIVLSGILAIQADDCLATYQTWFNMDAPVFEREWALLTGIRK
jgi:ribosomal protein L11 methyltransferase